jgi:oligoribonuclease (3'-5' exoribonuclease)
MVPYVSIDIETTGLDPENCQVIEIGAVIENWKDPVDELPTFHRLIKHDGPIFGEPFALSMHSKLLERIGKGEGSYAAQAGFDFTQWVYHQLELKIGAKFQVAGKNFSGFDKQFLRKLPIWKDLNIIHRAIDPGSMFWSPGELVPSTEMCKLAAGLSGPVAHTALEDALDIVKIIRRKFNIDLHPEKAS